MGCSTYTSMLFRGHHKLTHLLMPGPAYFFSPQPYLKASNPIRNRPSPPFRAHRPAPKSPWPWRVHRQVQ